MKRRNNQQEYCYESNCFSITFNGNLKFEDIFSDKYKDSEEVAIFFHEWLHFFHNISTISGFLEFFYIMRTYQLFRECTNDDGLCESSKKLESEKQAWLKEITQSIEVLYGDYDEERIKSDEISIIKIEENTFQTKSLGNQTSIITIKYNNELFEENTYTFGLNAILEGIAYELMCKVDPRHLDIVEIFPYKILSILAMYLAPGIKKDLLLKVAILALQTNDPAGYFVTSIKVISGFVNQNLSDDDVLSKIEFNIDEFVSEIIQECENLLGYFNSSAFKDVLIKIFNNMIDAQELRKHHPFFELYVANNSNIDEMCVKIGELLLTFSICQIHTEEDLMSLNPEINLWVAVVDFVSRHLKNYSFIETKDVVPSPCPFYKKCLKDGVSMSNNLCLKSPQFVYKTSHRCMYYSGIMCCFLK